VDLVGCADNSANGTFALVGDYHRRPLYRLLGPETRYLYFWDDPKDDTWCGWWIAEQTGANDYIEWFKKNENSELPTTCGPGETGGKVKEACLTLEIVEMISLVDNRYEALTIKEKLAEGFGKEFQIHERSIRKQMLSSASAEVKQKFDKTQKALEEVEERLAEERTLRQAAEARARQKEKEFRKLQAEVAPFMKS